MRQIAGFPEYREAMLTAIRSYPELADWRARSEGDLGVMLLEAWSVVLDTVAFYDARVSERSYLSTSPDDGTARNLTALIGHRPRPAMAASVRLAVEADGADPVTLPVGTGFRSGPFDGEPAQVFELTEPQQIWPQRNRWELAPVRDPAFDGTLRFLPRRAPSAGAVLAIWSGAARVAARVASVEAEPAPDGTTYQKAILETQSALGLNALFGLDRNAISVAILRVPMPEYTTISAETGSDGPQEVAVAEAAPADISAKTKVTLDAIYNQVKAGQQAVVEINGQLTAVQITSVKRVLRAIDGSGTPPAQQAVTKVSFTPALSWDSSDTFTLHASPFLLGAPSRIAKTQVGLDDIKSSGALKAPVDLGKAPGGGDVILRGAGKTGTSLGGSVIVDGDGQAHFAAAMDAAPFETLATPVRLHGNVVQAVRGETVLDEVLGSGNSAQPHQSFTLRKTPLAWVEDASLPEGRRPELSVRIGGVEWARVATFFGQPPEAQIYTVSLEPDGGTRVAFGDGLRGARLPSGVDNIRASYRFGAGSAKPPPGAIQSIARPTEGLLSVIGPLPATGGADAESAEELRQTAPSSTLTLGRAVSLQDFKAMAKGYAGILNAAAAWAWDAKRQRATVRLWIIADSGDPSPALKSYLQARAAPDLTVSPELAGTANATTLAITLDYAPAHDPAQVRIAVNEALFDATNGLLSPKNQTIGAALFRSALSHRIHQVPGVAGIKSLALDGVEMPHAVAPGQGNWFDLQNATVVS